MDQSPEIIKKINLWSLIRRACRLNLQYSGGLFVTYALLMGLRKESAESSNVVFVIMQAVIVALGICLLALVPNLLASLANGSALGGVFAWLEPSHPLMAALIGLAVGGLVLLPINLVLIGRGFYADITDPWVRYPPTAIQMAATLAAALHLYRRLDRR